eukprot:22942-Eustigmatos_ZCMA.PRE.1
MRGVVTRRPYRLSTFDRTPVIGERGLAGGKGGLQQGFDCPESVLKVLSGRQDVAEPAHER